eukprot:scaffold46777_cov32-Tisochrysis_lutea.AAC.2
MTLLIVEAKDGHAARNAFSLCGHETTESPVFLGRLLDGKEARAHGEYTHTQGPDVDRKAFILGVLCEHFWWRVALRTALGTEKRVHEVAIRDAGVDKGQPKIAELDGTCALRGKEEVFELEVAVNDASLMNKA